MEVEDLKSQLRRIQEADRKDKRKLMDEEAAKKIKKLEENVAELQKNLAAQKQVAISSLNKYIYLKENV